MLTLTTLTTPTLTPTPTPTGDAVMQGAGAVIVAGRGSAPAPRFQTRVARSEHERGAYFALRRAIFCDEQRLFTGDDRDACDATAIPIICVAESPGAGARVVGVVRIWEEAPGEWWGGRLGVDPAFRTVGAVGRWLVQIAVGTARAWGAQRFFATVQRPNVAFFRRLRWQTREELELYGQPHHLMEADLAHFAPTAEIRPVAALASAADAAASAATADDSLGACDDAA
jgi:putative N-acetyltransferase (TIGR04045 family)